MRRAGRSIPGCSVSLSGAGVHWREFLSSLRERGECDLRMIASDNHEGLKAACTAVFPGVAWQRCQVHLQRDEMRKTVARELRDVFNAPSREEAERLLGRMAERHREKAPRLASRLERAVPEGFAVFALPITHRRPVSERSLAAATGERHAPGDQRGMGDRTKVLAGRRRIDRRFDVGSSDLQKR